MINGSLELDCTKDFIIQIGKTVLDINIKQNTSRKLIPKRKLSLLNSSWEKNKVYLNKLINNSILIERRENSRG